jgi:heme-degrading monooxygenase HmoA
MVLERVIFTTKPGSEIDFQRGFDEGRHYLEESDGCRTIRLLKGVERPNTFLLLIEWDTLESHTKNFVETPRFAQFGEKLGPHLEGNPQLEHYEPIDSSWDRDAVE